MGWSWIDPEDWTFSVGKYTHVGTLFGLYFFLVHFHVRELHATIIELSIAVANELLDATIPNTGLFSFLDGGWSWADIVYDVIGWGFAFLLDIVVPPHIRPKFKKDKDAEEEEEAVVDPEFDPTFEIF